MIKNGCFVISLDFELLWGVFDAVDYQDKRTYFQNTRNVIPKILEEFSKYEIHATWAIVGMLFNENWEEWEQHIPHVGPSYKNKRFSAYDFGESIKNADTEEFCFAPAIIDQINGVSGQEIGTHTYSHFYCMEEGQTPEQFRYDLEQAVKLASKKNIKLKSLVFPRNQLNEEYLKICSELGIETIRSNPDNWYWNDPSSEALINKIFRTGEAYNLWAKRKSYPIEEIQWRQNSPIFQKASRFLRPTETNKVLKKLKMKRIKAEMFAAARKGEVYHLWWHPHNFGERPKKSLNELLEILDCFLFCRKKYHFQSLNMQELSQKINKGR